MRTDSATGKEKKSRTEFKAKVAFGAIRGEATIADLVIRHGSRRTVINVGKGQAIAGIVWTLSGKSDARGGTSASRRSP